MTGKRPDDRLTVRRVRGGFAVESPNFYCWDEDASQVLAFAEAMRPADDHRSPRVFDYSIDANDRIIRAGRGWSKFARANGAPELSAKFVVGRPLWNFVAGASTQQLYERVFDRVRRGEDSVEVPFRCDSAEHARWMKLAISAREDGRLDLRSTLVRETYRVFAPILASAPSGPGRPLPMCSFCKDCRIESVWKPLAYTLDKLDLFDAEKMPEVHQRVCPRCQEAVEDEIRDHSACDDPRAVPSYGGLGDEEKRQS